MPKADHTTQSNLVRIGLFLVLALFGFAALATTPLTVGQINGATQPTDWSMALWRNVLGDSFVNNPFTNLSAPSTLLGGLFVIFNGAIFAVGVAWLTYGVGSGLVGTAQDGEALGKRINTAWYPIRAVIGIAGLVPVFGGFTGSQALIMTTGVLGIGIANLMWGGAIGPSSGTGGISQRLMNPGAPDLTNNESVYEKSRDIMRSQMCLQLLTAMQARNLTNGGLPIMADDVAMPMPNAMGDAGGGMATLSYGVVGDPSICGKVTVVQSRWTPDSRNNMFGYRIDSVDYQGISNNIFTNYKAAITTLQSDLKGVVESWIQINDRMAAGTVTAAQTDAVIARFDLATKKFKTSLDKGADPGDVSGINKGARDNMAQWGWMSAGAWFATFAEVNSAYLQASKSVSFDVKGPSNAFMKSAGSELAFNMTAFDKSLGSYDASIGKLPGGKAELDNALKDFGCEGALTGGSTATGNCSVGQAIVASAVKGLTSGSSQTIAGMPIINPIIMFKNIGDYVMGLGSFLVTSKGTAKVAGALMSAGGRVGQVVGAIAGFIPGLQAPAAALETASTALTTSGDILSAIADLAWFVLGIGALMSIYIPLIPFINWMGAVIAYAASFLEGLIAMPLHSLSHLNSDGEGMGQQTSHGYLFLLNTLARPALMVLGFFMASALLIVLGTFQAALFLPAIANVQGNSITGMFSILAFLLIFAVINVTLINACFDLISVIPDQVIGFVGAGNVSTKLGADSEQKISRMYGVAVGNLRGIGEKGKSSKGGGNDGGKGRNEQGGDALSKGAKK